MSQALWARCALKHPEEMRLALKEVERFQAVLAELNAHHMPKDKKARRFYKELLAEELTDFAYELRKN